MQSQDPTLPEKQSQHSDPLEEARRQVVKQKELIAKQKILIEKLADAHQPLELALETLKSMQRTLSMCELHLSRLG